MPYSSNPEIPVDKFGRVWVDEVTTIDVFVSRTMSLSASIPDASLDFFIENLADRHYKEAFGPWLDQDTFRMPGRTFGIRMRAGF